MAFTVEDFADLRRLLAMHPEWQEELRRLILADDFLALPAIVRELAEAQRRTEARVAELAEAQRRTEARVEELAEAQRRTEARVEALAEAQRRTEARVEELAEAQRRTEARVEALAEAQRRTEAALQEMQQAIRVLQDAVRELQEAVRELQEAVRQLIEDQLRMRDQLGDLRGFRLEMRYAQHAPGYFGRWLRRVRRVLPDGLDPALEDTLEARLTESELFDLLQADLVVTGLLRQPATGQPAEIWLVVEVSSVIDRRDVERAQRRAALLRKAGFRAIPVVAGDSLTQGATDLLQDEPVALMLDGRSSGWEEALAAA